MVSGTLKVQILRSRLVSNPAAAKPAVATRVLGQVLLVVFLGVEERGSSLISVVIV
jgi:hypothetical protein